MKDKVKHWRSFMKFDLPLESSYISTVFAATHAQHQIEIPQWSTNATRQKMIAQYWFSNVFQHFLWMLLFPVLLTSLLYRNFSPGYLVVILLAGIFSFLVLLLFNYWPGFSSHFLPKLETAKESYERKQLEHLEKCRQLQLSNLALALVIYVFDKTSSINSLQPSEQYAGLLVKLYGVDRGSLNGNLELIMGHSSQRNNWTDRKRTEIENRFGEAYQFFEELHFPAGVQLLKDLEAKILRK